jgi:hypothetical protein
MISKNKIRISAIVFCSVLASCNKSLEIPKDSQIFAKHIFFDEHQTPKIAGTTDIEEFTKHEEYHDTFKLNNRIFTSEYTFTLHPDGSLHRAYYYVGNNSKIYSKIGLDTLNIVKSEVGKNFWIKISKSRTQIIDGKDTLDIEKIYPKEKLILVKQQKYQGRVTFYEYKKKYKSVKKNAPNFKE